MAEKMLTTVEAAEVLGVSRKRVFQLITDDVIKATQYGRSWLIPQSEVERYKRERKDPGRPSGTKDSKPRKPKTAKKKPATKRQKKP